MGIDATQESWKKKNFTTFECFDTYILHAYRKFEKRKSVSLEQMNI